MSNARRMVVGLTEIRGVTVKATLVHMADIARDKEYHFWQSKKSMAQRMGTDEKTVRRNINVLVERKLVTPIGERCVSGGQVVVYRIDVDVLLQYPCVETPDNRAQILENWGSGSQPYGKASGARAPGDVRPPTLKYPKVTHKTAEKTKTEGYLVEDTVRVPRNAVNDHLEDDKDFEEFLKNQTKGQP